MENKLKTRNTNSGTRNKPEVQIFKCPKPETIYTRKSFVLNLWFLLFDIVSDFVLRVSNFN
jgi:hypothetical protein